MNTYFYIWIHVNHTFNLHSFYPNNLSSIHVVYRETLSQTQIISCVTSSQLCEMCQELQLLNLWVLMLAIWSLWKTPLQASLVLPLFTPEELVIDFLSNKFIHFNPQYRLKG